MKGSPILPCIFILGLILQGALLYLAHFPEVRSLKGDEGRYQMKALQVASGEYPPQDFIWPPLYQYVVGAMYAVFGAKRLVVELFQTIFFFVTGWIFYRLILYAGLGDVAARVALFLFLLDPQIASFAQYLWPEILHLFFVFLMLALLYLTPSGRMPALFGAGLSLGAAMLTKSLMMPFAPILVLAAGYRATESTVLGRCKAALVFMLGVAVLVMPLILYNGMKHDFWGVADASAFNLWLGWRGDITAAPKFDEYMRFSELPSERNRIVRERVLRKISDEGFWNVVRVQVKRQYFRLFSKDSFLMEQFPGRRWGVNKVDSDRWLIEILTWWSYAVYACTLFLGAVGFFQVRWRRDFKRCILPGLFILYNLGLFLFFFVKTRYRIPIMPAIIFFAAFGVYSFLEHRKQSGLVPKPGFRFAAGCMVAALFLFLAFGSEPV